MNQPNDVITTASLTYQSLSFPCFSPIARRDGNVAAVRCDAVAVTHCPSGSTQLWLWLLTAVTPRIVTPQLYR